MDLGRSCSGVSMNFGVDTAPAVGIVAAAGRNKSLMNSPVHTLSYMRTGLVTAARKYRLGHPWRLS